MGNNNMKIAVQNMKIDEQNMKIDGQNIKIDEQNKKVIERLIEMIKKSKELVFKRKYCVRNVMVSEITKKEYVIECCNVVVTLRNNNEKEIYFNIQNRFYGCIYIYDPEFDLNNYPFHSRVKSTLTDSELTDYVKSIIDRVLVIHT
jgi:hypothetical protein